MQSKTSFEFAYLCNLKKFTIDNKMERINGEIRDREKVMRGLKIKETPILQGVQIYHNFIKPHEGLAGKTPAEACWIELKEKINGKL
jgi:hypothetical protein